MSVSQTMERKLYDLLPAVHKIRDQQRDEPLRALLEVIGEQAGYVRSDIDQLYDNWFIETCDDWVIPYIGELIGFRSVEDPGEPSDAVGSVNSTLNGFLFPRREVANTIGLNRRKGTLAILEELAFQVAGWRGRAVEFEKQVFTTPSMNNLGCGFGRTVSLHDATNQLCCCGESVTRERSGSNFDQLKSQNTPFDTTQHTVDIRSIQSKPGVGWYHPFHVGLFVWQRRSFSSTRSQPKYIECVRGERTARYFSFSPVGIDIPLHIKPVREEDPDQIAGPINLPMRLTRELLNQNGQASTEFYGLGNSVVIMKNNTPIAAEEFVAADLSCLEKCLEAQSLNQRRRQKGESEFNYLDPETGRFLLAESLPACDLRVTWHYGFPAELGGGEYDRPVSLQSQYDVKRIASDASVCPSSLYEPLATWLPRDCPKDEPLLSLQNRLSVSCDVGFELTSSDTWRLADLEELRICANATLELRASNRTRPVIQLGSKSAGMQPPLKIVMESGSRLILDGLLLVGDALDISYREPAHDCDPCQSHAEPTDCDDPCGCDPEFGPFTRPVPPRVDIRHCTLLPGGRPCAGGDRQTANRGPQSPSLRTQMDAGEIAIDHSIVGSIEIRRPPHADECRGTGESFHVCPVNNVELCIQDSIVDGCHAPAAIGSGCCANAHANLSIGRTTILGAVAADRIREAQDSIFYGSVHVTRRQDGYMRFCFVPRSEQDLGCIDGCATGSFSSRTPVRFKCQPDSAGISGEHSCGPERTNPQDSDGPSSVYPRFVDTTYGNPGYCQLAIDNPSEITRGAESESELGAFHDLFVPLRTTRLRQQLAEFTPVNMRSAVIFADDLEQDRDTTNCRSTSDAR